MPVPFPTATEVNLERPDAAEARTIAGGVAEAVAEGGRLTSLQRLIIEAITESMTGWVVPANRVPRLGPNALARALATRDELFRSRMVQFMLLCALVLDPIPETVVARIDEYSAELGVSSEITRIARYLSRGSYGLALVDFARSGYMETWDPGQSAALHTSRELNVAWEACVKDDELAARWETLRTLPDHTFGKQVANFYEARGFVFPGRPGSAPPLLAQHDWVHVLAGYGSTVESEIEVFALIARANDDPRAFSLLAQVVCLFETGYAATGLGLFEYDRGHLSHEGMAVRLADAMRRGSLCAAGTSGTDLLGLDWFELADQSVEDVRAHLHIEPKAERAVESGSVSPWEAGGISEYQLHAGQYAAGVSGHDYDSHGASAPTPRASR